MASVLRSIAIYMAVLAGAWASPAAAVVYNLNGTYEIGIVRGADIAPLISRGDKVTVEAFYDTDLARLRADHSPRTKFYDFPANGAGVRITVNDQTWQTTGPMTVSVTPVTTSSGSADGSPGATYGGPTWEGYTDPRQAESGAATTIQTPFGAETGAGRFILYLPTFPSALVPKDLSLPTKLSVRQLAGPNFAHGSISGSGPKGDYFFNFTAMKQVKRD